MNGIQFVTDEKGRKVAVRCAGRCRVDPKILALADNPRPAGCKKLKGYKDQWRVPVGDWRVVYIIDDAAKVVSIVTIAHRREVYE